MEKLWRHEANKLQTYEMERLTDGEQIFDAFDVGVDLVSVVRSHDPPDSLILLQARDGPAKDPLHVSHLWKK